MTREIFFRLSKEIFSLLLDKKKEDETSKFVQTASNAVVPTIAEILNKGYNGFIALLREG
jgi:hypothetical protein